MNIKEIVKNYLTENNFDGLYDCGECACSLDDLMPCDEPSPMCEPGYRSDVTCDCEYDFYIGPEKDSGCPCCD